MTFNDFMTSGSHGIVKTVICTFFVSDIDTKHGNVFFVSHPLDCDFEKTAHSKPIFSQTELYCILT